MIPSKNMNSQGQEKIHQIRSKKQFRGIMIIMILTLIAIINNEIMSNINDNNNLF